jgi:predicted lipid-binding transport protein (Tim44 family)
MLRFQDPTSTASAIVALEDSDRRVRTLAAQLLGRLRRPASLDPLLAMLDHARTECPPGAATDLQAALLALCELGAADRLLQAATAIHDSTAEDTGTALAYACQTLTPKLPRAQRVTFALAVLAHREPLVRRWAIGQLAELDEPTTVKALEGRLATEDKQLRPLVELALAQVRKDAIAPPSDEVARATQNFQALSLLVQEWWSTLSPVGRGLVLGSPVVLLLVVALLRRRRRAAEAAAAAMTTIALVQPSEEFAEQTAAEAAALAEQVEGAAEDEFAAAAPGPYDGSRRR